MKDNCSKYLGVVTSAGASDEHPMSTRSASDGRRWHSRGMQLICTLVLLFTFAIGQMWGEEIFGFTCTSSTTAVNTEGYTATGGTAALSGSAMSSGGSNEVTIGSQTFYKFNSSSQWTFTLSSGEFAVGDVISFTCACQSGSNKNGKGVAIQTDPLITVTGNFPKGETNTISYTVVAGDDIAGASAFSIKRNDSDIKFGTVSVTRTATGPVDPTASFSNGDYTIGGSDLDLSSLFTTNSDGAVTYTITDQGTTDAALRADGKSFYATVAGSAIVKVEQASTSSYNAYDATATITVAACETSISGQPSNASLKVGDANPTLSVTATNVAAYAWKESSDGTSYDGSSTLSTSDSYTPSVNDAVQIKYYYCEVTSSCSGSTVVKSNIVTVEVEAADPPCAELVPATSGDAPAAGGAISLSTATGGSMKALTTNISYTANGLLFGSSSSTKAEVTLNHLMQVGTVITATIYNDNNDKNRGLNLLNSNGTSKATWTKNMTGDHVETYTVVAGDGLAGSNVFQLQRNNNAYLKSITVSNCGAELHALTSAIDPVAADGKATITLSKSLVAEGATATATYSAIDAAYDFDEWVVSGATIDDAKANPVTITMGSTDAIITLKLKAASVKHTVTYYDGATELGTEQVEEGSNPTGAGLTPKKQGYTFGGWSLTNGGDAIASYASVTVDENKDLFAVWTPVVCPTSGTVFAFEMNESAKPGSEVKAPQKDILVIDEYLTITGQGSAIIGNTTNNTNQYASVKTDPKINLSGATGYLQIALECALQAGDVITIAKNNTQIYISDEVGTSGPTGNKYTTATNAENTIVVGANETTAAWVGAMNLYFWYKGGGVSITAVSVTRPAKHTLAWNFDGGNTTSTTHTAAGQVVEGAAITYPADNTMSKDGYTFSGWSTDVTEMPTSDLTITALWTAWPTMTLNRGAATSGDDVVTSVEPGSVVTVPACPFSYTDYNFNGWAYSPAVTMVDETHFTMPSENLTLTAQWVDANNVAQIGSTKYATFAEAAAAVADGETIQLLQDCDYDATWTITGMAVTLDLNGKNLTGPASGDAVAITTDGVLTIMDGTATVDPSINGSNEITYAAGKFTGEWLINVYAGGSFVMNSGWLLAGEAAAWVTNSGIVTVNNGVLEALTNAVVMGPGNAGKGGYTMNIHGGILLGHMSASGIANGYSSMAVYHPNTGTLNIDGGTLISENGPGVVVRGGASNITGGTIIAQGNGGGKCGDANAPLIGEVGVAYDFKANYPGVSSVAATISGTANVSGADGAVQAIYAATEPTATEEAAVAISGGTFSSPVAEALCADDYYPATKPSGKYGVTYAAESIDFEAFIDENGTGDDAKTLLASQLAAKHYELSETLNTDHLDAPAGKPQDKGLKVKKTGLEIYFSVEPEKVLEIKTGNISGASIAINGGAAEDLTSTSIATHTYYNDNAQAVVLTMTKAGDKYNIFQSINIRNPYKVTLDATTNGGEAVAPMYGKLSVTLPSATKGTDHFIGWYDAAENGTLVGLADAEYTPTADVTLYAHFAAQSNDGRLSDLQVDGTTVDGFDMDVHIYNLTVPYGTAVSALPKITLATAYDSYAQGVSIYPTDGPEWRADVDGGCYVQQANVTAEDGSVVYNQVRTKILPKDMACLIKATVTGDNAMAIDASASIYEGTESIYKVYGNAETYEAKSAPKFQSDGYLGVTLTTAGAVFQEGDVVRVFATKGIDNVAKLYVYSDNTGTAAKQIAESETALVKGYNEAALTAAGEGATSVFLCRAGQYTSWNPCIYDIAVYRAYPNPLVNTITFNGAAGTVDNDLKTITVEVPATTNLATMPVMASFLSNDPSQTNGAVTGGTWVEGDNEYIVTDKDNDQTVYAVTITKAVPSSDATLSALSYGGTAIALADGVFEYNVELPYGTSDVPALAATAHHAGASVTNITDADAFVNRHATSTVTVKAEDNTTTQLYTVNFTISAWKEIAIWDGSTMSAVATSPDATGLAWATTGFGSIGSYNTTYGEKAYIKYLPSGGAATSRYMTLTVPAGYVAKFYVVMASHSDGTERGMFIGSNLVKNPDATSVLELSNNDRDIAVAGMSEIVGEGTYYINPNASIDFQEIRAYVRKGYARTSMLGNGVYGTVCVPNNVAIEDIQGVTMYELMGRENTYGKLAFDEIVSGELEAGAPYVFQAHGDKMILFYGETSVSEPVDKGNGMYGTFEQIVLTELDDVYYFAQKALWSCEGAVDLTVGANRAYVKLSEIDYLTDPNPAPGRRRVTMTVNGEKVVTGVENLNASEQPVKLLINGQIFILRGEKLFDATGKLVK